MNPNLKDLHTYPFEKLSQLKHGIIAPADKPHIALSIGEPKHPTPHFIQEAVLSHLHGLGNYPTTKGIIELRQAIANWLSNRFNIPVNDLDPESNILPVSGTREALFSFAQCVINTEQKPVVIMPNPFYQIYEGAAILAGAEPYYLNTISGNHYLPEFDTVPVDIWQRCQLVYICSSGNLAGAVMDQKTHQQLLGLAEQYDFIIAADECYSEIYLDEQNPPPGLLQSAYAMGNITFERCIVFHSLSKRSNAPGLRSGFVAGNAKIMQQYFQYRTYHGNVMPFPTQYASTVAWQDENYVIENRQLYREKFAKVIDILKNVCTITQPSASFYIWLNTPINDLDFCEQLYAQENITVLPGSFLSRDFQGINPGAYHVRMALVAPLQECIEAAERIKNFINSL
jgi:N-succinyldiaminopimelate aminotransferase